MLDTAWHLVLPVITLTLAYLADYSLIMRSSLLDELGRGLPPTARAKGLRDVQVRNRHAVRNALLPTTTIIALNIGFVVSGAITIETVFSIPGLGLLATEALDGPGLLGAAGHLPDRLRRRDPRQPGRQPALRLARPAGAHMSRTTRPAARRRPRLRAPASARAAPSYGGLAARAGRCSGATAAGMVGLGVLIVLRAGRALPRRCSPTRAGSR